MMNIIRRKSDKTRKIYFVIVLIYLFIIETNAQDETAKPEKVYKLNYKTESAFTGGLFVLNFIGFSQLGKKASLDSLQVVSLNKDDIWSFDRSAVLQSHPAPANIYDLSDIGLWTSYVLPSILFLDDEIRKSWLDITLLYLETQAINLNIYVWGGPVFTRRIRPIVYYEGTTWDYKLGDETTDSFFSGHVSMTAGASFFMAKVYSDYHPELGAKKGLLFAAALIPPAFVGYCRYRGFMHFPSDILIGAAVGAATGILGPHFHKISGRKNKQLSIIPYSGQFTGVAVTIKL